MLKSEIPGTKFTKSIFPPWGQAGGDTVVGESRCEEDPERMEGSRVINSSDPDCTLRVQIWHKRWPRQLRGYLRVAGSRTHLATARGILFIPGKVSWWCWCEIVAAAHRSSPRNYLDKLRRHLSNYIYCVAHVIISPLFGHECTCSINFRISWILQSGH